MPGITKHIYKYIHYIILDSEIKDLKVPISHIKYYHTLAKQMYGDEIEH